MEEKERELFSPYNEFGYVHTNPAPTINVFKSADIPQCKRFSNYNFYLMILGNRGNKKTRPKMLFSMQSSKLFIYRHHGYIEQPKWVKKEFDIVKEVMDPMENILK